MTVAAVIVAAGRGTRAGGDLPKQWQTLAGEPVITHTVRALRTHPAIDSVVLVLHPDDTDNAFVRENSEIEIASGGSDRSLSVRAGLELTDGTDMVLIHDVARPLVSHRTVTNVIAALSDTPGAAPALPVTDALWTGAGNKVTGTHSRRGLYRAQTPQGFHREAIVAAHAAFSGQAADDVEVALASGMDVTIVPGDEDNLKITYAEDFLRAEQVLRGRNGH